MRVIARLGVVVIASVGAGVWAHQAAEFKGGTDIVAVYATVRARDGGFARNLTKDDFTVFDNGQRQEITVFSSDIQPITVALVLDRSGSMIPVADRVISAASAFVSHLLPGDRVSLSSLTRGCLSFTDNQAALGTALHAMGELKGMDFLSPILPALSRAMSSLGGHEGIRAVLLLTDGGNTIDFSTLSAMLRAQGINMPSVTQPAVLGSCQLMPLPPSGEESAVTAVARRENAVTYALALGRLTFEDSVKRIAEASGGKFVPLNLNDDLNAVFASIADDLHHEYLLGFSPKTWDGKVHQLEVRLTRSDLTARARQSYLADRTTPAPTATSTSGAAASAPGALLPAAPVLRETPPAQTTAPVPIETPQLPPLSSGDVDAAIKAGLSGKDLHASCTTSGIMSEPTEASVIIEGPVGRIMRAARDAKDRHVAFTAADVTDDMKAPTALVTADLKEPAWRTLPDDLTAPAQTTQHQPWYGTPLRGILLLSAGKELSPTQERAIDRSTTAAKDYVVTATFDLDTVKALIDPKVIVIRRSAAVRHQHEDPGDDPVAWSKGADGAAYGDARTAGTATPSGSPTSRNCRTSSARPGTATGPHLAQRARAVLTC